MKTVKTPRTRVKLDGFPARARLLAPTLFSALFSALLFSCFCFFCFPLPGFVSAASASASVTVEEMSNVTLTNLTVTPRNINTGTTADFSLTAENRGNVEDELSANVSITNSTGYEVYVINYTPVNVTPGSIVTLSTTWSSAGFEIDDYVANATGRFGATNETNSFSFNFSIIGNATPTPSPEPTNPSQGGGGGTATAVPTVPPQPTVRPGGPTTIPPSVKPKVGVVSFTRKTVLQEVLAGENALLSVDFKNDGDEPVSAKLVFSGLPAGTPAITPKQVVLQPRASSTINFALWIPKDATTGDYVIKISVVDEASRDEITTEYLFLRVKEYPLGYDNPIVLRRVSLDEEAKATNVVLSVRNPSLKTFDVVDLVEAIPSPIAATQNDVVFLDDIGSYLSDTPLTVAWRFLELEPEGKRFINYQVKTLSSDYAVYGSWFTKQVVTSRSVRLSDVLTITAFDINQVHPGASTKASFEVFYAGLAPMKVTALLGVPAGFKTTPQTISNVVLAPRTSQRFEFDVTADAALQAGSYSARAVVMTETEQVFSTVPIIVMIPQGASQFDQLLLAALALIALIAVAALVLRFKSEREKSYYAEGRFVYANSLRRIIFGDEKK